MVSRRRLRCLLALSCSMIATCLPVSSWAAEPTVRSVGGLSLRVDAELEIEPVASPI